MRLYQFKMPGEEVSAPSQRESQNAPMVRGLTGLSRGRTPAEVEERLRDSSRGRPPPRIAYAHGSNNAACRSSGLRPAIRFRPGNAGGLQKGPPGRRICRMEGDVKGELKQPLPVSLRGPLTLPPRTHAQHDLRAGLQPDVGDLRARLHEDQRSPGANASAAGRAFSTRGQRADQRAHARGGRHLAEVVLPLNQEAFFVRVLLAFSIRKRLDVAGDGNLRAVPVHQRVEGGTA